MYRDPDASRTEAMRIVDSCHEGIHEALGGKPTKGDIATSRRARREAGIPPVEETHPL